MSDTAETHYFQPLVTLDEQEDGTYLVEFDWSDAYRGVADEESFLDPEHPDGPAACDALDQWVAQQRTTFIIPPCVGN